MSRRRRTRRTSGARLGERICAYLGRVQGARGRATCGNGIYAFDSTMREWDVDAELRTPIIVSV